MHTIVLLNLSERPLFLRQAASAAVAALEGLGVCAVSRGKSGAKEHDGQTSSTITIASLGALGMGGSPVG